MTTDMTWPGTPFVDRRAPAALANFSRDEAICARAWSVVDEFRQLIRRWVDVFRNRPDQDSLLSALGNASPATRLDDEAIERNALVVFFAGISTVEALILNVIHALSAHPGTLARVHGNPEMLPAAIDETLRWTGPVQSATRHVAQDAAIAGVRLPAGTTVNCMIAAANRDPEVFEHPDDFDSDRIGLRRHLAFATGPHHGLGSNLARLEAHIALEELFRRRPGCRQDDQEASPLYGSEFRKPERLVLIWD